MRPEPCRARGRDSEGSEPRATRTTAQHTASLRGHRGEGQGPADAGLRVTGFE